jgi:hypothetical protein
MPEVAVVSGSAQTRMALRARNCPSEPCPANVSMPSMRRGGSCPHGDRKAEAHQHVGDRRADRAVAHHAYRSLVLV